MCVPYDVEDMPGKYHLITFGCQMNKNDSERIAGLLSSLGLESTDKVEDTDVIVVNTCSVRQSAEDRVYGHVRNWQKLRANKPNLIIVITGCMPGRDKDGKLRNNIKGVDLFFGIDELSLLPERLRGLNYSLLAREGDRGGSDYLSITPTRTNSSQVFVTIQTGCDNFCTYCVVPHARGREKNRQVKDILKEIRDAIKEGAKEATLLGQVVNNYKAPDPESFKGGKTNDSFAELLWEINQIEGLDRLHWTAADPQYFSEAQIQALTLPKQVNYLHLPVQSGDNEILRKMNRKYTCEQYINLVKNIRAAKPDIAIGTDIIVGFCGETEEQFENTMDLYRQCDFDISYQAMYSERSGTAAARAFKDDVTHAEKKRRWEAVQELMEEITYRKNQAYVGKVVFVLVERCENGVCSGNSREMKRVQFLGDKSMVGQIVDVEIARADVWVLEGRGGF
ncbi:MAG: (Dimethylallyl)adenosine tRNA methylthiotransferase MiaB [Candidatus Magasanikbacteria bacterium GW2011_GWA2_46_17]|uniref:tRNA-2-methylthio-N(6)-dimethylallyladenosine synthase n=1 Tax=Candidatus Magasanikbacteria bacterium GW2011_GWA2_46_17 TaxID=1619042 RepID=A0A0G1RBC7_9BACT|nr:MAG: (Dimethylallyl)adenosine tRNA methylthiotransferase MiaB [Candidatus Magasanikbacteria bacterium GW2011_GWA2_46_17]